MNVLKLHADTFNRYADESQSGGAGTHWVSRHTTDTLTKTFRDEPFTLSDIYEAYEAAEVEVEKAGNELGQYRYETGGASGPYKDILADRERDAKALMNAYKAVAGVLKDPIAYRQLVVLEAIMHPAAKEELAV